MPRKASTGIVETRLFPKLLQIHQVINGREKLPTFSQPMQKYVPIRIVLHYVRV